MIPSRDEILHALDNIPTHALLADRITDWLLEAQRAAREETR